MRLDIRGATTTAPLIVPSAKCQPAGRERGEFEGASPLMHAPPRAAKPSRKAGAEPPRGGGEGDGGAAPAPREGRWTYFSKSNLLDFSRLKVFGLCRRSPRSGSGFDMAHIAKYKAHSVGHMLAHYRRDPSCFERDNIDPNRVGRDYTIGLVDGEDGKAHARVVDAKPNWDVVRERRDRVDAAAAEVGNRKTRKDAVVLADLVITLPENVPAEDARAFFAYTYIWLGRKLGRENLMGGFVHRDEVRTGAHAGEPVRDHMHVPFTPIMRGRFNYKQMVPRSFYKTMHKELGDYLERRMGYRPEVALESATKAEKAKSRLSHEELTALNDEVLAKAEEQAAQIVAQAKEQAADIVAGAKAERDELAAQADELRDEVAGLTADRDELACEVEQLDGFIDRLVERVERFCEAVGAFIGAAEQRGRAGTFARALESFKQNPLVAEMFERAHGAKGRGLTKAARFDDALDTTGRAVLGEERTGIEEQISLATESRDMGESSKALDDGGNVGEDDGAR